MMCPTSPSWRRRGWRRRRRTPAPRRGPGPTTSPGPPAARGPCARSSSESCGAREAGRRRGKESAAMWTPKRIVLLTVGFTVFVAAYVVYAATSVGRIDGLPPLPECYWRADAEDIPQPHPGDRSKLNATLRLAFGPNCEEQRRPIRLELHSKNMVLASSEFKVDADGRVRLAPLSVALFGKPKGDGLPVEINTLRGDLAYL